MTKLQQIILAAVIPALLVGVAISLTFRFIKYSEFINPTIADISPDEAYRNILKAPSKYVFIDVRSEGEYLKAHASSSINLPIHYMYDDTHGLKNEKGISLPKNTNQEIYLICSGGRLAGVAYSYLEHYGYRNIKRIDRGLAGWNYAGLPIIAPDIFAPSKEKSFELSDQILDKPYELKK